MEAITCIKSRRSIRKYKEDSIPHELIEEIVDTARFAPSWKNTQTVRYICVEDPVLKQQIADHCTEGSAHNGDIISQAPALMALTYISGRSGYERDGSFTTTRGEAWECFDAGVAAEAFCLAAWEKGLGTCIMGIYDEKRVAAFLELPEGIRVGALIPVGYPADEPAAPKRKDVDMLLAFR